VTKLFHLYRDRIGVSLREPKLATQTTNIINNQERTWLSATFAGLYWPIERLYGPDEGCMTYYPWFQKLIVDLELALTRNNAHRPAIGIKCCNDL
jgi:hypothetical protein